MSISEILGTIHDGSIQVCATADAEYDQAAGKITVALDAFTRSAAVADDGTRVPQPWLPRAERVSEHLPREEADGFLKDVFHSWVKKLRAAIPQDLPLRS